MTPMIHINTEQSPARRVRRGHNEDSEMTDVIFLATGVGLFLLSAIYALACKNL
jgi:hypothetical protein